MIKKSFNKKLKNYIFDILDTLKLNNIAINLTK